MATEDQSITTVQQLFETAFVFRAMEDKIRIISEGKPRPLLKMFITIVKEEQEMVCQDINMLIYDRIQWLTGCPIRNKLFCWPCLLFGIKPGLWNSEGISEIIYATENKSNHESDIDHVNSMIKMELFLQELKVSKAGDITKDRENEEILKRLIDVCCIAIKQHDKCWNSSNLLDEKKCMKIMELLQNYDEHRNLSDKTINLVARSPSILNKVVIALTKAVTETISNEIKLSNYVSIILNQHINGKSQPLISTTLRFVQNGKVYERFVGFTSMAGKLTSDTVYKHILEVSNSYDISWKVCAVSLDGSILQTEELNKFLDTMKETLPGCALVPWYALDVDCILQQSLSSSNLACEKFFKIMSSMQNYFQNNSELFSDFINKVKSPLNFIYASLFSELIYNKCASSQFIITVKVYRQFFIDFFDSIINKSENFDSNQIANAFGFRAYLLDLQTIFLLEFFCNTFNSISDLKNAIKNDTYNFRNTTMSSLKQNLIQQERTFQMLWKRMKPRTLTQPNLVASYNEKINDYKSFFNTLALLSLNDTESRYRDLRKLNFCNMFNFNTNEDLKHFKMYMLNLSLMYKQQFSEKRIYNELLLLKKQHELTKKSLTDLYQFLIESYFSNTFKSVIDLMELILTMPVKPVVSDSNASKLQAIEKWSSDFDVQCASLDISLFSIEFDIFDHVTQLSSFHDEILNTIKSITHID